MTIHDITKRKQAQEELMEHDIRIKKLCSNVPGMIYQFMRRSDGTYCVPFTTEAIENIFGCSPKDVRDDFSPITRVVLPEDLEKLTASIEYSAEHMTTWQCEYRIRIPGQSVRWMFGMSTPEKLADGSVIWHGFNADITERKRAEEALKESEEKYRLVVENADESILIAQDGMLKYANPMTTTISGFSETELLSKPFIEIVHPDDREKLLASHLKRMKGEPTEPVRQFRICCRDGSIKWAYSHAVVISWNGKPATLNFLMDITEQRLAAEKLAESEKKYRGLFDFLPIAMFEVDLLGNVTSANPAIFETFGYEQPDFEKGLNGFEMIIPGDQERLARNIQTLLSAGWKGPSEYTGIRKDGSTFPILIFPSVIIHEGNPIGLRGAILDLTDRKMMEESLRKSNLSLAEAQRLSHIGNWEWDVKGFEVYWSDEIYRIAGLPPGTHYEAYESLIGLVHPDDREEVRKSIERTIHEGVKTEIEHRIVQHNGTLREVSQLLQSVMDDTGKTVRVVGIVQDITERRQATRELQRAKDQLIQSDKLASLGRLSAGVAHEILNPVNIISMELQILQAMGSLSPEVLKELEICTAQTKRIVKITQNLTKLARIPRKKTIKADINETIMHILDLYSTQLQIQGIDTEVQCQPDLPAIVMDKEQMEHVILNLISNALDAMEGKEKKVLRVKTEMSKRFGDGELTIMIADTGAGVDSELLSKIFDPFFTTKEPGKGTGLGLSISYNIVQDHGGMIWAANNEWGGASFYVTLPIRMDV